MPGHRQQPCLGYPSKREAILALLLAGETRAAICEKVDSSRQSVDEAIRRLREYGKIPASFAVASPRGNPLLPAFDWPAGKREKAQRLLISTLGYIAEALGVPVEALVDLVGGAFGPPVPQLVEPPAPPPKEPSRDEDEADLARLAAEAEPDASPPEPSSPVPPEPGLLLYRLRDEGGQYLTSDGLGLTRELGKAWKGNAQQCEVVFKRSPQWKALDQVRAP